MGEDRDTDPEAKAEAEAEKEEEEEEEEDTLGPPVTPTHCNTKQASVRGGGVEYE